MGRYFFHLSDSGPGYEDLVGIELPDDDAAIAHARQVAAELLKNRLKKTGHWRIDVRNAEGSRIFQTALITADQSFAHLHPHLKKSIEKLGTRCCALHDTLAEVRATQRKSRALVARSRGQPHLIAHRGELI